jgi:hypothetical protein
MYSTNTQQDTFLKDGITMFIVFFCSGCGHVLLILHHLTLFRPILNMDVHSYTLGYSKALLPYCAESLQCVPVAGTPSVHNNYITARSSLVHAKSSVAKLTLL